MQACRDVLARSFGPPAAEAAPRALGLNDKRELVGLDGIAYLATGGEAPWLQSEAASSTSPRSRPLADGQLPRLRLEQVALIHLTRCLAVALAPDITVNCVAPGLVEGTRMAQRIPPDVTAHLRKSVALGRPAEAGDVAKQVVTFCRTDTITGQVTVVDGGFCFH